MLLHYCSLAVHCHKFTNKPTLTADVINCHYSPQLSAVIFWQLITSTITVGSCFTTVGWIQRKESMPVKHLLTMSGVRLFSFVIMICHADVDECFSSPCSHYCENSVGNFSCRCADGYRLLDDGRSCIAADGQFN